MSAPKQKRKLISLSWIVEVKDGKLIVPGERLKKEISELQDTPEARLQLAPMENPKTHRQLRTFHGCIVPQVQAFEMATGGVYKSLDRIKYELKEKFLEKRKRYWDDGSPVIIKISHPTKSGVSMDWHMEELPSLSKLTIDQARSFIDRILEYYLHECGLHIEIDASMANPNFTD